MLPKFGEVLFSGSRFIFWALTPFLVLFIIVTTVMVEDWRSLGALLVLGLDVTAALLILALYNKLRFWWASRVVAAIVFLAYLGFGFDEVRSGKPWIARSGSDTSPLEALLGLVFIGVPSFTYAAFGRFGIRKKDQENPPENGPITPE